MIDRQTVERILDAAQIYDVVSDFVALKKKGSDYRGLCPFHEDRTPSFSVSPGRNICKCFACGEGGSPVHFIMKLENLSYPEALKYLAKKYNIEVQERELSDEEKQQQSERESLFILNDFARNYFVQTLYNTPEGKNVGLSYFRERGFREDIVKKFQLGYCLEQRTAFADEAEKNGFKQEYLLQTGLVYRKDDGTISDRFWGRVMFPIHTLSGRVVAFGGRVLRKSDKLAKYVNSPESLIYHKSDHLYGIYFAKQAIAKHNRCYLVEGYTDVISMHQAGIENVVASSGTALTEGQIKLIQRLSENITVLYDGDAAGIKAALRGIDLLLKAGMKVKVALLPDGDDPDSFARKHNATALLAYLSEHETDFIRFKAQVLLSEAGNDPIKKAELISDVANSISLIPDGILRSVYVRECTSLLNVDEAALVAEISKQQQINAEVQRKADNAKARRQADDDHRRMLGAPLPPPPATDDVPLPPEGDFPPPPTDYPLVSPVSEATPLSSVQTKQSPLYPFERNVAYYLVRYAHKPLIYSKEGEVVEDNMQVAEYVQYDLERDEMELVTPVFRTILQESLEHLADEKFNPQQYFLRHTDPEVSGIAADLLFDRYELSKIHLRQYGENVTVEETPLAEVQNLINTVPRVVTELKNEHVLQNLKKLKTQLALAQEQGDNDKIVQLMQEISRLGEIRRFLAKHLGERIVMKR